MASCFLFLLFLISALYLLLSLPHLRAFPSIFRPSLPCLLFLLFLAVPHSLPAFPSLLLRFYFHFHFPQWRLPTLSFLVDRPHFQSLAVADLQFYSIAIQPPIYHQKMTDQPSKYLMCLSEGGGQFFKPHQSHSTCRQSAPSLFMHAQHVHLI